MEITNSKVNVKIISEEAIKPSNPTPSHCKEFVLSYVDQILPVIPPFPTCVLLFYNTAPQTDPFDLTRLKTFLSETLTSFYPLAGRINQSTITCDDEGIPFIVAEVDCPLSEFLNSTKKFDLAPKLLPPRESLGLSGQDLGLDLGPNPRVVHLAIQVSTFTCGGVVIGWYDIHKITDGISSASFFKHWASLSSQENSNKPELLIQPNFDAAISMFPPSPKLNLLNFKSKNKNYNAASLIVKSFIFSNEAINELKTKAASESVPNPTRFQALSGFIWEQLLVVSQMCENVETDDSILQVTIDMRPFTSPPLPKESMGNLVDRVVARSQKWAKLPTLVAEIHAAVSELKDQIRGYDGVEGIRKSWDKVIKAVTTYKEMAYRVVSWCNLGFTDLDFGFGKPKRMVPTEGIMSPLHRNLVILTDYVGSNEEGIEAWFFLEGKKMEVLESNSSILAFASPA